MLPEFENFVRQHSLFSKKDRLLLALSGGKDSICLFHLLLKGNYDFEVAHCNYQLRGADSKEDENFVRKLSEKHGIKFHVIRFDTKKKAAEMKKGTQETARILRYGWFAELKEKTGYKYLLTAHHLNDNSETMLINMIRSTGLSGLHGIPLKNKSAVRPLMFADRDRIDAYINKHRLKFRHDISNDSDDYLRNRIRHNVVPELEKTDAHVHNAFRQVADNVAEFEGVFAEIKKHLLEKHTELKNGGLYIEESILKGIDTIAPFLYVLFREYGFSRESFDTFGNIGKCRTGTFIESGNWRFIRERNGFSLTENKDADEINIEIGSFKTVKAGSVSIRFRMIKPQKVDFKKVDCLYFDMEKCALPMYLRNWKKGDKMQPLGMKGSKKISDILTDKKVPNISRKQQLVLADAHGSIMALLPNVCSAKHCVKKETAEVLVLEFERA